MMRNRWSAVTSRLNPASAPRARRSTAGLVAVGVLALGLVVPALASASPEWYINGTPIHENKTITWTGSLELKVYTSIGLSVGAKCEDSGSGLIKTLGAGEEKTWTFKCSDLKECPTPTLEAKGLAWTTQLFSSGGKIFQEVEELFVEKSLHLTCQSTEKRTATCTVGHFGEYGLVTQMTNLPEGTVRASANENKLKCFGLLGETSNPGTILMTQTIKPSSGSLEVK